MCLASNIFIPFLLVEMVNEMLFDGASGKAI